MRKSTAVIHLAWTLIAGIAWWAGSSKTPTREESRAPARGRSVAGIPSILERQGARPAKPASATSGSTAEVAAWLDTRSNEDGTISPEQMSAAVLDALRDPDKTRGLRHFTHLLENLTPENAAVALLTLKASAWAGNSGMWQELVCSAWGAKDGASALAALTERKEREAAMSAWAASDPAAAQTWLDNLPEGHGDNGVAMDDDKRDLQRSMVGGLARSDVHAAEAYITARPERERGDLARVMAREMFRRDGPEAGQWAVNLQDSNMRGAALEMVAREFMAAVPADGAAWAASNATGPDMRAAVGRVADRIAEHDVLGAYAWTQQLPPGPGQEEAYQQVFSEWARQDPTASSEELLRMSPSPNRDQAIHSFSRSLVKENPESAILWAGAIGDPAQRLETQRSVANLWHDAAPEAATAWLTANLPAIPLLPRSAGGGREAGP